MRLECQIEGLTPDAMLLEFIHRVLRFAAGRVSLDLCMIGRVVIASPERFGAAVGSIQSGARHTNTETAVAAGKTIARREGQQVLSDIVLQASLFGALTEVLGDPPTSADWGIDQQQAIYIICHEFGHAIDHSRRMEVSESADPRSRPFSIKETAEYYGRIVPSEFAACLNSATVMTDSLFSHEMLEATNRMAECGRQVNYYLDNPDKLTPRALAHFVCQGAWVYMLELTKLYGSAAGIADREVAVRHLEAELLGNAHLCDFLDEIEANYPNWDVAWQLEDLTAIWHRYSELSGVRFVARDNGSDELNFL